MTRSRGVRVLAALVTVAMLAGCGPSVGSANGWTRTGIDATDFVGIVAYRGALIAVGWRDDAPVAWRSDDGRTWTQSGDPLPNPNHASAAALAAGPGGLVVLGARDDDEGSRLVGWHSTDGARWIEVDDPDLRADDFVFAVGAVWSGQAFVAVALRPQKGITTFSSPDGREWSRGVDMDLSEYPDVVDVVATGRSVTILALEGAHPRLIEIANSGLQLLSRRALDIDGTATSLAVVGGELLIGGCRRDAGSPDVERATVWIIGPTATTTRIVPVAPDSLDDTTGTCIGALASGPDGIVAVGTRPGSVVAWSSPDGVTWTAGTGYASSGALGSEMVAMTEKGAVALTIETSIPSMESQVLAWSDR